MPVNLCILDALLLLLLFLLLLLLFLIFHPLGPFLRAFQHIVLVPYILLEFGNSFLLVSGVVNSLLAEQNCVLIDQSREKLVETVLRPEEVKLEVSGFSLRQSSHKGLAPLSDKQRRQFDNFQVLRIDYGHARGEVECRRLWRALGLFGFGRGCLAWSSCCDSSSAALFNFDEAPLIKGRVGIGVVQEGELRVILLLVAHAI